MSKDMILDTGKTGGSMAEHLLRQALTIVEEE